MLIARSFLIENQMMYLVGLLHFQGLCLLCAVFRENYLSSGNQVSSEFSHFSQFAVCLLIMLWSLQEFTPKMLNTLGSGTLLFLYKPVLFLAGALCHSTRASQT